MDILKNYIIILYIWGGKNMQNNLFIKGLLLIVIFLFITVSVFPIIFGSEVIINVEAEQFFDIPTVVIDIDPYEEVYEGDSYMFYIGPFFINEVK